ncbi:MAG: UrcA family protein [Novosphingobium sp.]
MSNLRLLCLPLAMAVASTAAIAQPQEITALGRTEQKHDWLSLHVPDGAGSVTARIDTSDLDLTTATGRAALDRRIAHAKGEMCRAALNDPDLPEIGLSAQRACLRAARVRFGSEESNRQAAR